MLKGCKKGMAWGKVRDFPPVENGLRWEKANGDFSPTQWTLFHLVITRKPLTHTRVEPYYYASENYFFFLASCARLRTFFYVQTESALSHILLVAEHENVGISRFWVVFERSEFFEWEWKCCVDARAREIVRQVRALCTISLLRKYDLTENKVESFVGPTHARRSYIHIYISKKVAQAADIKVYIMWREYTHILSTNWKLPRTRNINKIKKKM